MTVKTITAQREESPTSLSPSGAVGITDDADMYLDRAVSTRSGSKLVSEILRQSCLGIVDVKSTTGSLVESLVWPFVARTSLRSPWFTRKEFGRMIRSFREVVRRIASFITSDNREQTFLKFHLDSLMCRVFRDSQRPSRDAWNNQPLFSGWLRRFVDRAVARRDLAFIYSLAKGSKRAWPQLGPEKLSQAYADHRKALGSFKGFIPESVRIRIEYESLRTFGRIKSVEGRKLMPSGSACLQASRRKGGALSLFSKFTMPDASVVDSSMDRHPSKIIGRLPYLNLSLNSWRQNTYDAAMKELQARHSQGSLLEGTFDVDVVAIPEPGKFRIITKGDGYLYTALQPLQGLLLDCWKHHRASTMRDEDLTDRVRSIDKMTDFQFWCSVDYKSATDLLKRDASVAAFSGVSYEAPNRELGLWSLIYGRARYPRDPATGEQFVPLELSEGQLMGHPLSFPLLCLINFAVYMAALDEYQSQYPFKQGVVRRARYAVLVNGDDMLFKCDIILYRIFLRVSKRVGFQISQGKNFLSPDSCMINSQVYIRRNGLMTRKGYLNLKIVLGTSLKEGDSNALPNQIARDLVKMITLCPWTICSVPASFQRFSGNWSGGFTPNWYLPSHLGGYGLPLYLSPGCNFDSLKISRPQREMAARFVSDPRLSLYRFTGISTSIIDFGSEVLNWRPVYGSYVPQSNEERKIRDGWLERLSYLKRAVLGASGQSDDGFVFRKFKPDYRLKPMSRGRLRELWEVQYFATVSVPCPPFPPIRCFDLRSTIPLEFSGGHFMSATEFVEDGSLIPSQT